MDAPIASTSSAPAATRESAPAVPAASLAPSAAASTEAAADASTSTAAAVPHPTVEDESESDDSYVVTGSGRVLYRVRTSDESGSAGSTGASSVDSHADGDVDMPAAHDAPPPAGEDVDMAVGAPVEERDPPAAAIIELDGAAVEDTGAEPAARPEETAPPREEPAAVQEGGNDDAAGAGPGPAGEAARELAPFVPPGNLTWARPRGDPPVDPSE